MRHKSFTLQFQRIIRKYELKFCVLRKSERLHHFWIDRIWQVFKTNDYYNVTIMQTFLWENWQELYLSFLLALISNSTLMLTRASGSSIIEGWQSCLRLLIASSIAYLLQRYEWSSTLYIEKEPHSILPSWCRNKSIFLYTLLIAEILSGKNVRAWVSMDFI